MTETLKIIEYLKLVWLLVQGAAFSMVLRGTEKTVIDRKKVAYVFW